MRTWLVRWMYVVVAGHLLVGVSLPWVAQGFWLALFGPTLQAAALWMAGLTVIGDKQRNAYAWGMLILGLVVWAPQDMLLSARAEHWDYVWLDLFALAAMLPPLLWLCKCDLAAHRKALRC